MPRVPRAQSLPPLRVGSGVERPARYQTFSPPIPRSGEVLRRVLRWVRAWTLYRLAVRLDRLLGRDSEMARARRARASVEAAGPDAVVVARQLAMRLDLVGPELAEQLLLMEDPPVPMDLGLALAEMERAAGRPLDEVYEVIDPEPVVADALSCVYQARLVGGAPVAIRVRRPDIAERLGAELVALRWVARGARLFQPEDSDVIASLQDELRPLLFENLDYVRVARLQTMLRKRARRDRMRWVSAARVFRKLSSSTVLVSEFVPGVFLSELMDARRADDETTSHALARAGVPLDELGRRLLHVAWWSFFENLFFVSLPDPQSIVVRDGVLVFVAVGDAGRLSEVRRKHFRAAFEAFGREDIEGATEHLLSLLLPLPRIDVHAFTKSIENALWARAAAMRDKQAPKASRASTGLWLAVLQATQEHGVVVALDVSRAFQALCIYDHVAGELWPDMLVFREFKRYRRRAAFRQARLAIRRNQREAEVSRGGLSSILLEIEPTIRRLTFRLERAVDTLPVSYIAISQKGAHTTQETLRALVALTEITVTVVLLRLSWSWVVGPPLDLTAAFLTTVRHPGWLFLLFAILGLALRRILLRIDDLDPDAD